MTIQEPFRYSTLNCLLVPPKHTPSLYVNHDTFPFKRLTEYTHTHKSSCSPFPWFLQTKSLELQQQQIPLPHCQGGEA